MPFVRFFSFAELVFHKNNLRIDYDTQTQWTFCFVGALNIFAMAAENDCPAKFMANMIYGKLWISIIVHVILFIIFDWKTKADRNLRNRSNHNWFLTVGEAIRCRWRHANRIVMQPKRDDKRMAFLEKKKTQRYLA